MKKPVRQVCAYCGDSGWAKKPLHWGWGITKYSPLFGRTPTKDVYQCPYCGKPEDAPPVPEDCDLFKNKVTKH